MVKLAMTVVLCQTNTYEDNYFTLTLDTSKRSHLCFEELEVTVSKSIPPPTILVGPIGILFLLSLLFISYT